MFLVQFEIPSLRESSISRNNLRVTGIQVIDTFAQVHRRGLILGACCFDFKSSISLESVKHLLTALYALGTVLGIQVFPCKELIKEHRWAS